METDLLAQKAAERNARPAVIWHSGKLRAKQTAEAFWRRCNPLATFAAAHGLQPTDQTSWIVEALATEQRDVMLVGHFPQMPRLLGHLLVGSPAAPAAEFPLNGIVALEDLAGRWGELWRLSP